MSESEKKKAIKMVVFGALMALLFVELFSVAWCRVQCVRIGYDISESWKERGRLLEDQEALKVELAHLRSPARIMRIGEEMLGLVMPRPEQVVVVSRENKAG